MAKEQLTKFEIDGWLAKNPRRGARLYDGGNLCIEVGTTGKASWMLAFTSPVTGKRRQMGLGAYDGTLKDARARAERCRRQLDDGLDPILARNDSRRSERAERQKEVTFKQVADDTLAVISERWTAPDAVDRWDKAIAECSKLHSLPVRDLTASDVADVLKRITASTTRRFVQLQMRRVFDTAIAKGLSQANPADARIVGKLVSLKHKTTHQPALHWRDVPAYVASVRAKQGDAARCMEMLVRCGVRRREATEMRFDEIDFANKVWNIPADRTKQRRAHSVPLPEPAFQIVLEQRIRHPNASHTFPGGLRGKRGPGHLSHAALQHLTPEGATVHGFRSALRSFLGDMTTVSYETAEGVLGHLVGDATVRAYRRESDLERRREALELWNSHLDGSIESAKQTSNVVAFQQVRVAS
ncbi:tyrosine-type recombinase/integrase [Mesorhizobium marinum]|uniref:Tyrosine-type recombinase/integrase n=1 Tax=Mesorhizobium marinum TaxID=3228790 RepID=A0ABV3R2R5_9HYPH